MRKVIILDTSILCVWLKVPGKQTCGSGSGTWTFEKAEAQIKKAVASRGTLVLPLAAIIEAGNHISQASGDRYSPAASLAALMEKAADRESPWAAFVDQAKLWDAEGLKSLSAEWPELAKSGLSMGDATIKRVAEFYAQTGSSVELMTGDQGLKAYQPATGPLMPRRRRRPHQ